MAWGAIAWFDGYTKANQADYLASMLKWGTDWVMQAHPDDDTFYVQVLLLFQFYIIIIII